MGPGRGKTRGVVGVATLARGRPEHPLVAPQGITLAAPRGAQPEELAVELLAGPTYSLSFPEGRPQGVLEVWVDESPEPFDQPSSRGWGRVRDGSPPWVRLDPYRMPTAAGSYGPWTLTVRDRQGHYLATGSVRQIAGVQEQRVEVREHPVGAVDVRVTLGGEPIDQRLSLMVVREAGSTHSVALNPRGRGYAPNRGRARIGHLAEGPCFLVAGSQGHGWTRVPCEVVAGETVEVSIDVPRASEVGSLNVLVRSETGERDLGGIQLLALQDGALRGNARFLKRRSDGSWEYAFEDLGEGEWTIRLEQTAHLPPFDKRVVRTRRGQASVEFLCLDAQAGPSQWFEVAVVDDVTSEPLPHMGVTVYAGGGRHGHHLTDAEGRARVGPYIPGFEIEVVVRGENYRSGLARFLLQDDPPPVKIRMQPGWGTRLDIVENGPESAAQPIEGVRILSDGLEMGISDADGRFRLDLDRPPRRIELVKPGYRYLSGSLDRETLAPPSLQGAYPYWLVMERVPATSGSER